MTNELKHRQKINPMRGSILLLHVRNLKNNFNNIKNTVRTKINI